MQAREVTEVGNGTEDHEIVRSRDNYTIQFRVYARADASMQREVCRVTVTPPEVATRYYSDRPAYVSWQSIGDVGADAALAVAEAISLAAHEAAMLDGGIIE